MNVVFIHGFTGDSSDWGEIELLLNRQHNYYFLDLPGCGKSDKPSASYYYTQEGLTELISEFLSLIIKNNAVLCGYSMGGRIVLSVAATITGVIKGLILESSSPGLTDDTERTARLTTDKEWIKVLEEEGIRVFIERWMETELFRRLRNILSGEKYVALVTKKSNNSPSVLINYLKEFGTGIMSPLWGFLRNIEYPVLLISGEEDIKYSSITKKMEENIISRDRKHCPDRPRRLCDRRRPPPFLSFRRAEDSLPGQPALFSAGIC